MVFLHGLAWSTALPPVSGAKKGTESVFHYCTVAFPLSGSRTMVLGAKKGTESVFHYCTVAFPLSGSRTMVLVHDPTWSTTLPPLSGLP
jgi:hypothetical protein